MRNQRLIQFIYNSLIHLLRRVLVNAQLKVLNKQVVRLAFIALGLMSFTVPAVADIAVIIHPANPLATLTQDDVRRIFMGRMRMFPDSDASIEAVDQNEASSAFERFYHAIARLPPAKLKRQRASYLFSGKGRLPTALEDDASVLEFIASHPDAIGYVSLDKLDARVKSVLTIKE